MSDAHAGSPALPTDDAPLGAEDAAKRADVGLVFVDVRELIPQPQLHTNDINSIRIVVGKKGSGKTHILRYIEENASQGRVVIFFALNDNNIPGNLERQFSNIIDRPNARKRWSKFWRVVVSLTVLARLVSTTASTLIRKGGSRFLIDRGHDPAEMRSTDWRIVRGKVTEYISKVTGQLNLQKILFERDNPSIGSVMHKLLDGIHSIRTFDEMIDSVDMDALEADVSSLSRQSSPFHVIIDGIDDVSWRQPRLWLDFQVGLFDAVFYFNEAQRNSSSISITVAIRNFVYLAAAESPHIDRVRNLLSLNWSPESALSFLNRRLSQISGGNFSDADKLAGTRPLAAWLGFDEVNGLRRSRNEDVETYFLRHTRLSPRNLIKLFNSLCEAKNRSINAGRSFGVSEFRYVVDMIANEVADAILKTAAEEIIAFLPILSSNVVKKHHEEGLLAWVTSCIEIAIRSVETEVIEWGEYQQFLDRLLRSLVVEAEMEREEAELEILKRTAETILWRTNTIAFWNDRRFQPGWSFSWAPQFEAQPPPGGRVGFHSSLIGRCRLKVSEYGPVF